MERLSKIFSLIDNCITFADIGCDHGKLCKLVADSHKAERIIASDISAASLSKAKELLKNYGCAEFYVSDGFNQIPIVVDCAVISGMGGREILKIISNRCVKTFILQPQNHIALVRRILYEMNYIIAADEIVKENNKFYFVIKAVLNGNNIKISDDAKMQNCEKPTAVQEMYGMFYSKKSALLKELLEKDEKKYSSFKPTKENADKLKIIREAILCQQ